MAEAARVAMTEESAMTGAMTASHDQGHPGITVMADGHRLLQEAGAMLDHQDDGKEFTRRIYHIVTPQGLQTWIEREATPGSYEYFYQLYHYLDDWEGSES